MQAEEFAPASSNCWSYFSDALGRGVVFFLLGVLLPSVFLITFQEPLSLLGLLLGTVWLCFTCPRIWVRWLYAIPMAATLIGLGMSLQEVLDARPMPTRVNGARFTNAPLPEVVRHFAVQKGQSPQWTFRIHGKELSERRITVDIPSYCTLEEALSRISHAARANCEWHYWKGCGNAPRPSSVKFRFWEMGHPRPEYFGSPFTWVTADFISYSEAKNPE
jgi:hypothetical protein